MSQIYVATGVGVQEGQAAVFTKGADSSSAVSQGEGLCGSLLIGVTELLM